VQVEFVSANPTGPLHVAHGRGAALGDAIASLLQCTGDDVEREFYVNDAGVQIDRLAESLEARWLELTGTPTRIPEGGYHGDYLRTWPRDSRRSRATRCATWSGGAAEAAARPRDDLLREEQDRDLREFGVRFDSYFPESRLYEEDRLKETLENWTEHGLTYESDGALWLRSIGVRRRQGPRAGEERRLLHVLPARHRVSPRQGARGFDHVIDVWGADHHGYVPRMQAALSALGMPDFPRRRDRADGAPRPGRHGSEAEQARRRHRDAARPDGGDGPDVARYFFLMRRGDTQMLFDLDLALDQSEKNPVYKVQYAHARMCSIFRKAGVELDEVPADADVALLTDETEQDLIKQLEQYPGSGGSVPRRRARRTWCATTWRRRPGS
jgi:arginyl-tRNA synthetase